MTKMEEEVEAVVETEVNKSSIRIPLSSIRIPLNATSAISLAIFSMSVQIGKRRQTMLN